MSIDNVPPSVKVWLRFTFNNNNYSMLTTKHNKLEYKTFLRYARSTLKLNKNDLKYLELSDDNGNIFDEVSFENYMLLFPIPRQVFRMKLNYLKEIEKELSSSNESLDDLFQVNCMIEGNSSKSDDDFVFAVPERPKKY